MTVVIELSEDVIFYNFDVLFEPGLKILVLLCRFVDVLFIFQPHIFIHTL